MQGIEKSRDDEQHGDPEPEDPVGKEIFGESGEVERFTRHGPGLHVSLMQVVTMHENKQKHGNKRPEFEFPAVENGYR